MRTKEADQKWVYLVLLGFAVVIAFLSGKLIEFGVYQFHLHRKVRHVFLYGQLIAVGVGALSFWGMVKYSKLLNYIQEVVSETIKVSWPSKKDVVATTIVVIIGVVIAGVFLGVFDHFFSILMRWVIAG